MNIQTTHAGLRIASWLVLCAALLIAAPVQAQNPPRYDPQPPGGYQRPQYESPLKFLPKFGKRMSEMVRRLFYGKDPTGRDQSQPGHGSSGGYSLDSKPHPYPAPQQQPSNSPPPPGYQPPGQAQPRYNYPPQQSNQSTAPAPLNNPRTTLPPKMTESPAGQAATTRTQTPAPVVPPSVTAPTPRQPPATATRSGPGSFLKGKKSSKPGRVISPYPPYKELDITGLESGSLALDPTTQKIFEVP